MDVEEILDLARKQGLDTRNEFTRGRIIRFARDMEGRGIRKGAKMVESAYASSDNLSIKSHGLDLAALTRKIQDVLLRTWTRKTRIDESTAEMVGVVRDALDSNTFRVVEVRFVEPALSDEDIADWASRNKAIDELRNTQPGVDPLELAACDSSVPSAKKLVEIFKELGSKK